MVSGVLVHYGTDSVFFQLGITNALLILPALLLRDQHRFDSNGALATTSWIAPSFSEPLLFAELSVLSLCYMKDDCFCLLTKVYSSRITPVILREVVEIILQRTFYREFLLRN